MNKLNTFKSKFISFYSNLSCIYKKYAVENVTLVAVFIVFILKRYEIIVDDSFLVLTPFLLTTAFCLNSFITKGKLRVIYYLSWIPFIPLSLLDGLSNWAESSQYIISVAILAPIAFLLCRRNMNNENFFNDMLSYCYTSVIALVYSLVIHLITMAILYSTFFIFNIDYDSLDIITFFTNNFIFFIVFPSIFFSFLDSYFGYPKNMSKIFDILINKILTPALLIYTVILYVYFIKIIIIWELPKGSIAYMVFIFNIIAVIVNGLRYFTSSKVANVFFDKLSFISITTLGMFWVGVIKRVSEFGLTEMRVFLIVCGIIMSLLMISFMFKTKRNYYYITALTFIFFAIMAYIPFCYAKNIALRNQIAVAKELSNNVELLNQKQATRLVSAYEYLSINDKEFLNSLNFTSTKDLINALPKNIADISNNTKYIYLQQKSLKLDSIENYNRLFIPTENKSNPEFYTYNNDTLKIYSDKKLLLTLNVANELEKNLNTFGYSLNDKTIYEDDLNNLPTDLSIFRNDSYLVKLSNISLDKTVIMFIEDSCLVESIDIKKMEKWKISSYVKVDLVLLKN